MLILDGENPVASLTFTPDATRLIVTRSHPWRPETWPTEVRTIATGECVKFPQTSAAPVVAMHPSGRFALFATGDPFKVAVLADGTTHDYAGSCEADDVIVSPNGEWVIASYIGHLSAFRCDPDTLPLLRADWAAAPRGAGERLAGFLDGGAKFVTVGGRRFVVRDTATGEVKSEARYPADSAILPTISADGSRLAVRSSSQFYIYDTANWKVQAQLATETRPYVRFTYHPTRPLLAAIMRGQTLLKFLNADTIDVVRKFNWRLGEMRAVCFSPDGTLCAAGGMSGKVVVWDVDE